MALVSREASQAICSKLFLELWHPRLTVMSKSSIGLMQIHEALLSSKLHGSPEAYSLRSADMERDSPMPKGCY